MALALLNLQENRRPQGLHVGLEISRKTYTRLLDAWDQEMVWKHQESGLQGFLKLHTYRAQ